MSAGVQVGDIVSTHDLGRRVVAAVTPLAAGPTGSPAADKRTTVAVDFETGPSVTVLGSYRFRIVGRAR